MKTRERTDWVVVSTTKTPSTEDWGPKEAHRDALRHGYWGIIYNWLIRRCGTVVPGRPADGPAMGLRPSNRNGVSIHIGVVGGMEDGKPAHNFQRGQLLSLKNLIEELTRQHPGVRVEMPMEVTEALKGIE